MRKLALFAALAMAGASIPAKAQVVVDMSLVTCKQYQTLIKEDPDKALLIASWMGGYFSASKNLTTIDFRYAKRNTEKTLKYCKSHGDETLLSVVQKIFH
jgi:acid stress chaperone HdeB